MDYSTYMAVEYFHRLTWRILCLEAAGMEFQKLFESVTALLEPSDFVKIKPIGQLGDRKTDGLLYGSGTVYQVYAPEKLSLEKVQAKIREDLDGAIDFWGDNLTKWVFVCNTSRSRGIAADIVQLLQDANKEHPHLEIEYLSDDGLWEKLRSISPIRRNEVLGPPVEGFAKAFIPPADLADPDIPGLMNSRVIILHDNLGPANIDDIFHALEPQQPFGLPLRLNSSIEDIGWTGAAEFQKQQVDDLVANAAEHLARFAVFPLSEIPLLIHFGYVLGDTKDVELYQYHRDRNAWDWSQDAIIEADDLVVSGEPDSERTEEIEVCIRLSLSAVIQPRATIDIVGTLPVEIDITSSNPTRGWLSSPDQLVALRQRFREVIDLVIARVPNCTRIHLFYAGPAPGAVAIGQSINPRMTPPIQLYEYDRNATPQYQPVLELQLSI